MIDTSPLYDVRTNRYKGVYAGPGRDQWDAIVQTPDNRLKYLCRCSSPEEAARAVATYYRDVFGPTWGDDIKTANRMRRDWRIKRLIRFPQMAHLHRGPKVVIYTAEVQLDNGTWFKIAATDVGSLDSPLLSAMWNAEINGWHTSGAALVAIRTYQLRHKTSQASPSRLLAPSGS